MSPLSSSFLFLPASSTAREILLVALAMDQEMRELNTRSETVLQACRAGGWFAYRPDATGQLRRADAETWAQVHQQAAGRVSAEQLSNCSDWQNEAAADHIYNPDPQAQPEADCLDLEAEVAHLETDADIQAALAASLHPSDRSDALLEKQISELGFYKDQIKKQESEKQTELSKSAKKARAHKADTKKKTKKKGIILRSALSAKFREKLAAAGGIEKRLEGLTPKASGKVGAGQAGQSAKKAK